MSSSERDVDNAGQLGGWIPPTNLPRAPLWLVRPLVVLTLASGAWYLIWRYTSSINWNAWAYALLLLAAETYSYLNAWLFGLMAFRLKRREAPPQPAEGATVDIFIACYNEPVEIVRETALAALAVRWPHRTYILDDGASPAMETMAADIGVDYVTRSGDWDEMPRHAKAGNINNALERTNGEFVMILDCDQIPFPDILHRTLGYFRDPGVALVQTPQWFYNVPKGDPFGSQALLFYGPIQEGKDGWKAAFFCGSNAVLRRDALLQIGIQDYVRNVEKRVDRALAASGALLDAAESDMQSGSLPAEREEAAQQALAELRSAVEEARRDRTTGLPVQEITFRFQRRATATSRLLVSHDLDQLRSAVPELDASDPNARDFDLTEALDNPATLEKLSQITHSPLAAFTTVRDLLLAVDVSRSHEAQAVMPISTISITEDMATSMRLHAAGFTSVYHDEILARGLAPEDLGSAFKQRLRWAQGTLQVWLKENPLTLAGLSLGQRLMYFGTIFSYMSGFSTVLYLLAPIIYLFLNVLPVSALSTDFWLHLAPYLILNQVLFIVVGWRRGIWRGQQYSLALFPLWIHAVISTVRNVYRQTPLTFAVTPKTRGTHGSEFRVVRVQLVFIVLLCSAVMYGLIGLWIGMRQDELAVWVNIVWVAYDLAVLSIVVVAATQPASPEAEEAAGGRSSRIGAGRM